MSSWQEADIHYVDFEGCLRSGIVEYGVVSLRHGRVQGLRTRLCTPTGRIRPEETAVHGLDERLLSGNAPFSAEWDLFTALRGSGPLAAHNASAENSMLRSVWPYGHGFPDFMHPHRSSVEWGPWLDSALLARVLLPHLPSVALSKVIEALGLQAELDAHAVQWCPPERTRYHAAPYDALAGALVLLELAKRLPSETTLAGLLRQGASATAEGDDLGQGSLF